MPAFKNHTVRGVARGIRAFFGSEPDIKPENIVWIFGQRRTGSSWLSRMMRSLKNQKLWHEPYVGEIFGSSYYLRSWDWQREREGFILANPHKKVWLKSIRDFVLDGARARFPEFPAGAYLVIKEPHGSIGAPLIMQALPESRMIFLIRDPRDIVASCIDADKKGSWTSELRQDDQGITEASDAYVKLQADMTLLQLEKTKEAYEAHEGHKVLIRYEDLRYDTLETMKRLYSALDIPVDEEELNRVVESHSWENVPEEKKGTGKFYRKATPGGWREDFTPEQIEIVEQVTAPILKEFYQS